MKLKNRMFPIFSLLVFSISLCFAGDFIPVSQTIDCGKVVYLVKPSSNLTRASFQQALDFSPTEAPIKEILDITLPCPPGIACDDGSPITLDARSYQTAVEQALEPIQARIDRLQTTTLPPELAGVRENIIHALVFWRDLHLRRAQFYESWDLKPLRAENDGIDPRYACGAQIGAIDHAPDKQAKWSLAAYQWQNCVNTAFRNREKELDRQRESDGGSMRQAWQKYLDHNKIQWKYDPVGNTSCR